ncbi:hypothetical protein U1Q18_028546 [Sarracenia purpurea var. burkii]
MGKLSFGRVLSCICLSSASSTCFCINSLENQDEFERDPIVAFEGKHVVRHKDALSRPQTMDFQLKPKMVVLRVSMHCNGCARKVEKHISKMEGVTSYQVDLKTKMVVVIGDIVPVQVLESVSRVKTAELWTAPN